MSSILIIAPHADDETLGMGGTIARRTAAGDDISVAIVTGHGAEPHPLWSTDTWELVRGEAERAMDVLGVQNLIYRELPAACLDNHPGYQTNQVVDELLDQVAPDELYLPYYHDLHRDHTALSYAGLVSSRPYLTRNRGQLRRVLMYETPTETHLLPGSVENPFVPNSYVDISDTLQTKLDAWACYRSQQQSGHTPRSIAALKALATWRGAHAGVEAAEAFMIIHEAA